MASFRLDGKKTWIFYEDGRAASYDWASAIAKPSYETPSRTTVVDVRDYGPYLIQLSRYQDYREVQPGWPRRYDCRISGFLRILNKLTGEEVARNVLYYTVGDKNVEYFNGEPSPCALMSWDVGYPQSLTISADQSLVVTFTESVMATPPLPLPGSTRSPSTGNPLGSIAAFRNISPNGAAFTREHLAGNNGPPPLVVGGSAYSLTGTGQPFSMNLITGAVTMYQPVPGTRSLIDDGLQVYAMGSTSTVSLTRIGQRPRKVIPVVNPAAMATDGAYVWVADPATNTIRPY